MDQLPPLPVEPLHSCGFGGGVCDNLRNLSHTKVAGPDGEALFLCGMHRGRMNRDAKKYQAEYAVARGLEVTDFSWAPDDRGRMLKDIKNAEKKRREEEKKGSLQTLGTSRLHAVAIATEALGRLE